ncbi:MAG: cysteine desulfurase NifS [Kiritimatiellae bacterium]|nr:cysteine desulfurase NifS [Kiritimatiellia bacterium]
MKKRIVYLDNNATTRVAPEVTAAMMPFFEELWGNPSSMHTFGGQVHRHIDAAREKVAALIGAEDPSEIIFTSCGSESNNTALRGVVEAVGGKPHVIVSCVEHPCVLSVARHFKTRGHLVTELQVDGRGRLDLDQFRRELADDTAVVSVMWANNETGVMFPIEQIGEIVHRNSHAVFHTDAVQVIGKLPVRVRDLPIDLLSLSGHKLHAPKGVGALYIRKGTKVNPLIIGGHQEFGKRAGTENVPYIVGFGKACELALAGLEGERTRVARLRDTLEAGILKTCPDTHVNGDREHRLPNTTNISFEYVEGEAILLRLDELGICASSGSACTSGSLEPSHVIRAMGVPFTRAHGSTRFSLSRYNTEEEIDYVLQHIPGVIKGLREISPFAQPSER